MGKPIVYCDVCGKSINAESILLQEAVRLESSYYCKECAIALNIKTQDKNRTIFKKPIKKKVDFNEMPDISTEQSFQKRTIFTKYRKELTYVLYGFSIFVIIFSALFIVYRYALNKPSVVDIAKQECELIEKIVSGKGSWKDERDFEHIINKIESVEDVISNIPNCYNLAMDTKRRAQERLDELKESKAFIATLSNVKDMKPIEAIIELKTLRERYEKRNFWSAYAGLFQDLYENAVSKLWNETKNKIENEYEHSTFSYNDYKKLINNFVKEHLEENDVISKGKKKELLPDISYFRDDFLKGKFEKLAENYRERLISVVANFIKDGQCDDAKKEITKFPSKYRGTNAYETRNELQKDIDNCIKKEEESRIRKEEEQVEKEDELPDVIIPPPHNQRNNEEKEEVSRETIQTQIVSDKKHGSKQSEKLYIFNGKELKGWKVLNNNANWQVWDKKLYGKLVSSDKTGYSIIYYTQKSFKNFSLSFQYKLISGDFFVYFWMSPDKPTEAFSIMYPTISLKQTDGFINFYAKVLDSVALIKFAHGDEGGANFHKDVKEGFIGFYISKGTEIYFKDIYVEEITETAEQIIESTSVPIFNGADLKNWITTGAKGKWVVSDGAIYGENNLQKKDDVAIDMSTLSVLYFDDKKFEPGWTNYEVTFDFNITEDGFLIFGKYPTEGNADGVMLKKEIFAMGKWYQAVVTVTPEKITTTFPNTSISAVDTEVKQGLKGYFGFGLLPQQKVFIKNIRLKFIK